MPRPYKLMFREQSHRGMGKYRTTKEIVHEYSTLLSLKRAVRKYYASNPWTVAKYMPVSVEAKTADPRIRLWLVAYKEIPGEWKPEYVDLSYLGAKL